MFDWLFKFDRINFAEGEVGLQGPVAGIGLLLLILAAAFCAIYFITKAYTSDRTRSVSLGLRLTALLLLCLPLLEPVLIMPDVVPDENFVAVVADVSGSMSIPDGTLLGETRRDDLQQVLFGGAEPVLEGIAEHFKLRYYTFSGEAARTDSLGGAGTDGLATNIAAALERVLADFRGLPLTGIVLLTDGGDNSDRVPRNLAEELRSLDIPLHVVGLGREAFDEERELLEVVVGKGVEETTGAEIDVRVRSWGAEAEPVAFNLYRGEDLVFSENRPLKGGGRLDQFTFFYEPREQGVHEYTVEVAPAAQELNTENNRLNTLIDTRKDSIRVLYFEGHLRRDFKFIKRALEDDQVVEFTSVSRTGPGKLYRQGIRSPEELAGGFPATEEELYGFKAVILGDIEASAFSPDQLTWIERFVRIRGGGFLMVGGRTSFAEGDYWDTPVDDLLPVSLDPSRRTVIPPRFTDPDAPEDEQGFRFAPTAAGYEHPILKLSPDPSANRARWAEMPRLTSINYLGPVKPGAVVLAEKPDDAFGGREPLLVLQRYGKGRSMALATASTWRWQLQLDAEDQRHERFWRQLARALAAEAPDYVHITLAQNRFAPGDEIPLAAEVFDRQYAPVADAAVRGRITGPDGAVQELPLQPVLAQAGTYTAPFVTDEEGVYELEVEAEQDGTPIGTHTQSFLVRPSKEEFQDATLKRAFLTDLAQTADGFYYEPEEADAIPVNLRGRRTSTSIYQASYLWDMPLLFGLILLLLSLEWIYRRRKGLP